MSGHKVNHLDSLLLDNLYQNIIVDQLLKPFPFDNLKKVLAKISIKTVYLAQGLWRNNPTQGNQIYNLSYSYPSKQHLPLHYIFEVFHIVHNIYREELGILFKIWNLGIFLNWVLFLTTGKFRTLMERLGKISLKVIDPSKKLNIDYMYTQRVIFFSVVSETIKVVLPYLKIESLIKFLNDEINFSRSTTDSCSICGEEDIVSPVLFPNCEHFACYFCFSSRSDKKCPSCKA